MTPTANTMKTETIKMITKTKTSTMITTLTWMTTTAVINNNKTYDKNNLITFITWQQQHWQQQQ